MRIDLELPDLERLGINLNHLSQWLDKADAEAPKPDTIERFYSSLPRVRFLKTLARDSILLEAGAGDGGLIAFKNWISPTREDITFWGTSLSHSGRTREYDYFAEGRIGDVELAFPGQAHAFIACHLIEHLESPYQLFEWLEGRLLPGSTLYLEWPSWHSQYLPRSLQLPMKNITAMTLNFFDDSTHNKPILFSDVLQIAENSGYQVVSGGLIGSSYYADLLRDIAYACPGEQSEVCYYLTMALWQKTYFSSFIELKLPF